MRMDLLVFVTRQETSGNGLKEIITKNINTACAAVPGSMTVRRSCGWLTASTATFPTFASSMSGSGLALPSPGTQNSLRLALLLFYTRSILGENKLPRDVLNEIRIVADERDVPYQPLIKMWLVERLKRLRRRLKNFRVDRLNPASGGCTGSATSRCSCRRSGIGPFYRWR